MVAAGLLSLFGALHPTVLVMVLGGFACAGGIALFRRGTSLLSGFPIGRFWILAGCAGVLAAVAASTLSPFYDQWHYHLAFPYQWLRAGAVVVFEGNAYSFFPANMGLLFVYGLAGPGPWAAQLIHLWMGAVAVLAVAHLGERLRPGAGAVAAAIFACTPAVFEMATTCGAELGVAAFGACAWLAVSAWRHDRHNHLRWAVLCGLLIGLAVGSKYLALLNVALPFGLLLLFFHDRENGSSWMSRLIRVATIAAVALAVSAPWFARNFFETGDPVYPYLSAVETPTMISDDELAEGIGSLQLESSRLRSALTLGTFERLGFAGQPGPVYLWLLPFWLVTALWRRDSRLSLILLGGVALGLAAWAISPPFGRYLIPTLTLAAVGSALVWTDVTKRLPTGLTFLASTLLAVVLISNVNVFRTSYSAQQIGVAIGVTDRESVLRKNVSHWPAIEVLNESLPKESKVLLVAESRSLLLDHDFELQDPVTTPILVELASSSSSSEEIVERLRQRGLTHVLLNRLEAERMAAYNQRERYLSCRDPAAQMRLDLVVGRLLEPVWHDGHLTLYRIPRLEGAR
jgi:hypothetical protein